MRTIISGDIIKGNQYSDNQYETHEYGPLYKNTLSKFIGDKFSGDLKHGEEGSILTFEKQKFSSYDEIYNHQAQGTDVKIDVTLVNSVSVDLNPEGTDGTDGSSDGYDNFETMSRDSKIKPSDFSNPSKDQKKDLQKQEAIDGKVVVKKEEYTNPSPKPSEPSEPSAFPPKCYHYDFSKYHTKGEYNYHCVTRHPGLPGYPGPADIREGLTPQGMPWEI